MLRTPRYGFKLNAARDAYEVNEAEMEVVRHVFPMEEAEGTEGVWLVILLTNESLI